MINNKDADFKIFNQNEGLGGFKDGAYDPYSIQPTHINWTRQSKYIGPKKSLVLHEMKLPCYTYNDSFVVGREGIIYIGCHEGFLLAIKPEEGIIWEYKHTTSIQTPVIGDAGTLYTGTYGDCRSMGHKLMAIDNSGSLIWELDINYSALYLPVLDADGSIYIATEDTSLYSISKNGSLKWCCKRTFGYWSAPFITRYGQVCIGSGDKYLHVLNQNGENINSYNVGHGRDQYAPIIDFNGTIYFNSFIDDKGKLIALNINGAKSWEYIPNNGEVWTSPALSKDGILYFGTSQFRLSAIRFDGSFLWEIVIKGFPICPPIISNDGTIYYTTFNSIKGKDKSWISAISPGGEIMWQYEISGQCSIPLLIGNGKICIILKSMKRNFCILRIIGDS